MGEDFAEKQLRDAILGVNKAKFDAEWDAFIARLEKMAERNPKFAKWFDEFCAEQERLLRDRDEGWDAVIGDSEAE
jgi:hypothetical protein